MVSDAVSLPGGIRFWNARSELGSQMAETLSEFAS